MLKKIALTATVISTIFGIMKDCNAMRRAPSPIEKIDPRERKHNERTAGIQNCETKIKQACENQTGESLANSINAVLECNPGIQNSLSATTPSSAEIVKIIIKAILGNDATSSLNRTATENITVTEHESDNESEQNAAIQNLN